MKYLVYKFDPPDHVVGVEEADAYWEEHLFVPLEALAAAIPGDPDQLVILNRLFGGMAEVEASPTALASLMGAGYTVKAM
jgi:hypothetical protein